MGPSLGMFYCSGEQGEATAVKRRAGFLAAVALVVGAAWGGAFGGVGAQPTGTTVTTIFNDCLVNGVLVPCESTTTTSTVIAADTFCDIHPNDPQCTTTTTRAPDGGLVDLSCDAFFVHPDGRVEPRPPCPGAPTTSAPLPVVQRPLDRTG